MFKTSGENRGSWVSYNLDNILKNIGPVRTIKNKNNDRVTAVVV